MRDDRGDPCGQMNAPVTVCDDTSYCGNTLSFEGDYLSLRSGSLCGKPGCLSRKWETHQDTSNVNASTSSSASRAAGTISPSSTPAKNPQARTIVIGVIEGLAGSALGILGTRLVMIVRNMRADLAARNAAALKLPGMI